MERELLFASLRWRLYLRWWRLVGRHVSGWRDRRFLAQHLAEQGWPMTLGCGAFSHPESLWHACTGHDWERIDWPYGRADRGQQHDRFMLGGGPRWLVGLRCAVAAVFVVFGSVCVARVAHGQAA